MAKIGDTVRFLNSTGGGKITRIEGKMAFVDENGFETPVLIKDLVVVLPAGHESAHPGANIMFDQAAFDKGKEAGGSEKKSAKGSVVSDSSEPERPEPIVKTAYGDELSVAIAFEPSDIKNLGKSRFTLVIVNDSNYHLDFTLLRRADGERGWSLVYSSSVPPNELVDAAVLTHEDLPQYDRIAFQALAYKKDEAYSLQPPVNVIRNLDLTKFHKLHCFRPGIYFDNPVIEIQLVKDGVAQTPGKVDPVAIKEAMVSKEVDFGKELSKKYRTDTTKKKSEKNPKDNPHKLLPLIEVDLHIGELVDTLTGLQPKDMLDLQLDTVRRHMKDNALRKGQKIVFIHGKGDGVLRKAVLDLLKKEYPKAELQDASFREYGFGATLVTVH